MAYHKLDGQDIRLGKVGSALKVLLFLFKKERAGAKLVCYAPPAWNRRRKTRHWNNQEIRERKKLNCQHISNRCVCKKKNAIVFNLDHFDWSVLYEKKTHT